MSRRAGDLDLSFSIPPRLTLFSNEGARALRIPLLLFAAIQIPLGLSILGGGLDLALRFFYGLTSLVEDGGWRWLAVISAPALLADFLYLFGRLEWVMALPDPREREAPPPPLLAIPREAPGALRPFERPALPLGRRVVDGLLFFGGLACLGVAWALALLQVDTFDSVLGVKLGGTPFGGTYWNRWWFVYYGFIGAGIASISVSLGLFIYRLNGRFSDRP